MYLNHKLGRKLLIAPLLFTTLALPLSAQDYGRRDNGYRNGQRTPDGYYNGVRDGGRNGNYDRNRRDRYRDDNDERYRRQGGIGPGKGAAIGAGGGAILGALFGGGLKGAVIGGAAGAGVGALAGKAAQDHRRDQYYASPSPSLIPKGSKPMIVRTLRTTALTLAAAALVLNLSAHPLAAQTPAQRPSSATETITNPSSASHTWTTDQIVTATVHQAWVLSGKDETAFFEIVKELAEISAQNRNLTLPDNPAAGRRAGAYIKAQAKADHDQLLYAIVDKSVRMTATKAPSQGQ